MVSQEKRFGGRHGSVAAQGGFLMTTSHARQILWSKQPRGTRGRGTRGRKLTGGIICASLLFGTATGTVTANAASKEPEKKADHRPVDRGHGSNRKTLDFSEDSARPQARAAASQTRRGGFACGSSGCPDCRRWHHISRYQPASQRHAGRQRDGPHYRRTQCRRPALPIGSRRRPASLDGHCLDKHDAG